MKKFITLFLISLVVYWLIGLQAVKAHQENSEIKSYSYDSINVNILINKDSTFDVAEEQCFNFVGNFHFAYREIALKRLKSIDAISVLRGNKPLIQGTDLAEGDIDKFEVESGFNNAKVTWYFDEKDTKQCWTVKYRVRGGIGFFDDHDELYWNAIFSDRSVSVAKTKVVVTIPGFLDKSKVPNDKIITLFPVGVASSDFRFVSPDTYKYTGSGLEPNSDFTIVAGWQKGLVIKPPITLWDIFSLLGIFIPFIVFLWMLRNFLMHGRDEVRGESIAPEFGPPSKDESTISSTIAPALVEMLTKEKMTPKSIVATVVDLARRGYLTIIEDEKKGFLGTKKDFRFVSTNKNDGLEPFEKIVLQSLFGFDGDVSDQLTSESLISKTIKGFAMSKLAGDMFTKRQEVAMSDLKNKFYTRIPLIDGSVKSEFQKLGYYKEDPSKVKGKWIGLSVIFFVLGAIAFSFLVLWGIGLIISGLIIIGFGIFMSARTKLGSIKLRQWKGFKLFLEKTERFGYEEKITAELFFEYLPYAIIFGVEKRWSNRFGDIQFTQPDWYHGAAIANFSDFGSDFSGMVTSVSSTFTSSPSSSSGFGGGGAG